MTMAINRPLPEALGRNDTATKGEWVVKGCEPTRGLPVTSVEERFMRVPLGDDELSSVIRMHELVHAKISPLSLTPWIERGFASEEALRSVEEVRVNLAVTRLGYDTSLLADGSETATGERAVALGDWRGAVMFAIATAGTGAHKKFLTGVRRHNKVWGDVLADIGKRAMKEIKKIRQDRLNSTLTNDEGLMSGFGYVERISEWVDRLAGEAPRSEDEDKPDSSSGSGDTSDETGEGGSPTTAPPKRGRGRPRKEESKTGDAVERSRNTRITSGDYTSTAPSWMKLRVEKVPLPDILNGSLGKKRVASVSGKSPRRLHRLLTDPQRRVFDKVVRGKGGIVVIDCSGSMRLTREQVVSVVHSAPGCTVLAYTVTDWTFDDKGEPNKPNAWVLAHEGRVCDELPFSRGHGNGVDLPALEWAVKNRRRSSTPIVWVSDGQVTGMGDNSSSMLAVKVVEFVGRHGIAIVPNTDEAVKYLTALSRGDKPRTELPHGLLWALP